MRGEAHQAQAERVSLTLDFLEGRVGAVLHLEVKDFHAVEAQRGRPVDALGNSDGFAPELPE